MMDRTEEQLAKWAASKVARDRAHQRRSEFDPEGAIALTSEIDAQLCAEVCDWQIISSEVAAQLAFSQKQLFAHKRRANSLHPDIFPGAPGVYCICGERFDTNEEWHPHHEVCLATARCR